MKTAENGSGDEDVTRVLRRALAFKELKFLKLEIEALWRSLKHQVPLPRFLG